MNTTKPCDACLPTSIECCAELGCWYAVCGVPVPARKAGDCHHCDVLRVADVPEPLIAANHAGHKVMMGAAA